MQREHLLQKKEHGALRKSDSWRLTAHAEKRKRERKTALRTELGKTEKCLQRNLRPLYCAEGHVSSFLRVQRPSARA